jgi:hypothetical protein
MTKIAWFLLALALAFPAHAQTDESLEACQARKKLMTESHFAAMNSWFLMLYSESDPKKRCTVRRDVQVPMAFRYLHELQAFKGTVCSTHDDSLAAQYAQASIENLMKKMFEDCSTK